MSWRQPSLVKLMPDKRGKAEARAWNLEEERGLERRRL